MGLARAAIPLVEAEVESRDDAEEVAWMLRWKREEKQGLVRSRTSFLRYASYRAAILCLCGVNPCEGQRWERQKGAQSEDPVGRATVRIGCFRRRTRGDTAQSR